MPRKCERLQREAQQQIKEAKLRKLEKDRKGGKERGGVGRV